MQSSFYDVTLYWHDGGSLFLGTLAASSAVEAQDGALRQYIAQGAAQKQEIEDGGSYEMQADPLQSDEAAAWRNRRGT